QRVVLHERDARHAVALRRELRERDLPHAERDEAVRDAGSALEPHRVTGLERALELRGADGLDTPHGGATPRGGEPGHHARDEPAPTHGHHHRPDVRQLLRDLPPHGPLPRPPAPPAAPRPHPHPSPPPPPPPPPP